MSSFSLNVNPREAQYARLVGHVLATLRAAVARRAEEGLSQKEIGDRIDMDKSSLSRVLNGRIRNLTLKTVSDILWATEHEPTEFGADGIEDLSAGVVPRHLCDVNWTQSTTMRIKVVQSSKAKSSAMTGLIQSRELQLTND